MTPFMQKKNCLAVIIFALTMVGTAPPALAASLIIDDFQDSQAELQVTPLTGPLSAGSSAPGTGIIGGSRDLVLSTESGPSPFSSSAEVAGGVAQLADNSQFSSTLLFQWDGIDNDPDALDTLGLGGIDLTSGGNNAFEIGLVFEDLPATLNFMVYDTTGGVSEVTFPGTGLIFTELSIFIPFAAFSGDADLSAVGAIELLISSPTNGLDIELDFVQTSIAPVPVPGAVVLMISSMLGLSLIRKR